MPVFDYKAITKKGKEVIDILEADNVAEAVKKVRGLDLFPVKVVEQGKGKVGKVSGQGGSWKDSFLNITFGKGVKSRELVLFIRQFASLVAAGIPLLRALKVLCEQQKPGVLRKTVGEIQVAIEAGSTLSESMGRFPKIFNRLFVSMVRAAEAAGVLDTVFLRMADYFEKSSRLMARIRSALVYPVIVILAAIIVMLFLMVFIIPKFAEMFADMDLTLPKLTLLLIGLSNMLMSWIFWIGLLCVGTALVVLFKIVARTHAGRVRLDAVKLRLPVFGPILHSVAIARFARTLGTLISSGVPILKSLVIVKDTIGNEVFARAINQASESIREGESIAEPLRNSGVFTPVVVNMIAIGEETGKLDDILTRIADQFDEEVDVKIATLTTLLEPFLIVVLAVIVGVIVISLFLPLISLMSNLGSF